MFRTLLPTRARYPAPGSWCIRPAVIKMVSCCFLSLMTFLSLAVILKTIEARFTDAMRLTFDPAGNALPCKTLCNRSPFHPNQDEERQLIRKLKTGQYRL